MADYVDASLLQECLTEAQSSRARPFRNRLALTDMRPRQDDYPLLFYASGYDGCTLSCASLMESVVSYGHTVLHTVPSDFEVKTQMPIEEVCVCDSSLVFSTRNSFNVHKLQDSQQEPLPLLHYCHVPNATIDGFDYCSESGTGCLLMSDTAHPLLVNCADPQQAKRIRLKVDANAEEQFWSSCRFHREFPGVLMFAGRHSSVHIHDLRAAFEGLEVRDELCPFSEISAFAVHPTDSNLIAAGTVEQKDCRIYDLRYPRHAVIRMRHPERITHLSFDGSLRAADGLWAVDAEDCLILWPYYTSKDNRSTHDGVLTVTDQFGMRPSRGMKVAGVVQRSSAASGRAFALTLYEDGVMTCRKLHSQAVLPNDRIEGPLVDSDAASEAVDVSWLVQDDGMCRDAGVACPVAATTEPFSPTGAAKYLSEQWAAPGASVQMGQVLPGSEAGGDSEGEVW